MLTINCTLSLIGEGAGTTIVNCQDSGYLGYWPHLYSSAPIQINADNVVVSGFSLLGGQEGIYGVGSGTQIIGNIIQQGVTVQGSQEIIANNTINGVNKGPELGSFSAISIQLKGTDNKVIGNQISSDGMAGVDVFGSDSIVYGNNIFAGPNAIGGVPGVQLEYSSGGITIAKNNLVNTSINIETASSSNVICGNTIGGAIWFMGFNNSFYGNTLTWRVFIGGTHGGSVDAANNFFFNNNFMVNAPEVEVFTGSPGTEFWDNGAVGNYWSNYTGQDLDNNRVGDQPYLVTTSYSTTGYTSGNIGYDHYPLMSPFDISTVAYRRLNG